MGLKIGFALFIVVGITEIALAIRGIRVLGRREDREKAWELLVFGIGITLFALAMELAQYGVIK